MAHEKDLTARTPGEDLWLRRRALGLTQVQMARRMGVGRGSVWGAERDLHRPAWARGLESKGAPGAGLQDLLALARRRSGLTLRRASRLAGTSHVTFLRWEARGEPGLASFWRARGFRFPGD